MISAMPQERIHFEGTPRPGLPRRIAGAPRRAFTLIELLVVVAILIVLLTILIIAVNAASRTAQKASTQNLMDSMKKGLIRFKEDIGYYPPLLGPAAMPPVELRKLFNPPLQSLPAAAYSDQIQDW